MREGAASDSFKMEKQNKKRGVLFFQLSLSFNHAWPKWKTCSICNDSFVQSNRKLSPAMRMYCPLACAAAQVRWVASLICFALLGRARHDLLVRRLEVSSSSSSSLFTLCLMTPIFRHVVHRWWKWLRVQLGGSHFYSLTFLLCSTSITNNRDHLYISSLWANRVNAY